MDIKDIAKLYIPHEFGCDDEGEETEAICDVYDQLDNTVTTDYGASKFVIISDYWERVVKIPFNGEFFYTDDYDSYEFQSFTHKDYCAMEADVYEKAVDAGIEMFFAGTRYEGRTESNVPYYTSEKAYNFFEYIENKNIEPSKDSKEKVKKNSVIYINIDWLGLAYDYYGDELMDKFFKFIKENKIRDLHNGNIGIRANGAPVLIDYSGFQEF